jgi:hypothetical protein
VPSLLVERFAPPTGARDTRRRAYLHALVADGLGGRTVWCAPRRREALERQLAGRAPVHAYGDGRLGAEDIVMLDDADLSAVVRECGAHAVVRVRVLPRGPVSAVDAYLIAWRGGASLGRHLAAVMPHSGRVVEADIRGPGDDLAWSSVLADLVAADRDEHVGGRRHARPAVPVR